MEIAPLKPLTAITFWRLAHTTAPIDKAPVDRMDMPGAEGPPKTTGSALPVLVTGIIVWLLLVAPVLDPARQLGQLDTARLFYPLERTIASAYRAGRLPFWDPYIECGTSLLGQVTPAPLHPFALLYLALPFGVAFKLEHLLALLLGGCGAALLARELGASRWPALVGGIAFGGSGTLVSAASANLPFALGPAVAPLALAGLLWLFRAPGPGRLLASSLALALCAYGGDPQSFGIAILVGVVVTLWDPPRWKRARWFSGWAACGLLLCAPAALPGASQLRHSQRKVGIAEFEQKMFFTPPVRLFGLAVPMAFDGVEAERLDELDPYSEFIAREPVIPFLTSICLGAPALLFAAMSVRRKRSLPILAVSAVLIAASTGPVWHVQSILEAVVPGWSLFRYTEKFLLHASWLLSVAAALGAEAALLGDVKWARRLAVVAGALAAVALVAWLIPFGAGGTVLERFSGSGYTHSPSIARRFLDMLQGGVIRAAALCALVAAIAILRILRPASLLPAMLAAAAAAVSALVAPPLRTVRADLYEGRTATGSKLLELGGPSEGRWRVLVDHGGKLLLPEGTALNPDEAILVAYRESLWPQLQSVDGIEGAAVYFSAPDSDYSVLLHGAGNAGWDVLGIRFSIVPPRPGVPTPEPRSESGFGILERRAFPRAFVVNRTRIAADSSAAAAALRSTNVLEEAFVSQGGPVLDGPASRSSVELRRPSPERMDAAVESAARGLLIVSEHYDPGWRATVDGRETPVHRADLAVLGIPIPAGRHEVRLRFNPVGFLPGVACAALTALALGVLALRRVAQISARIDKARRG